MSSEYGFILDNMRWSFSSVSSFETCPLGFKYNYIEAEDRIGNFYSDFGLLVHDVLEKFFNKEIQIYEMVEYYEEHYKDFMVSLPPTFPKGMGEKYYETGLEYFSNFDFDLSLYEVVEVEKTVKSVYNDIELTTRPDLILREKSTGKYSLVDFKTSKFKKNTRKRKKANLESEQIINYMHQFQLYAYIYWIEKDIEISDIRIWFIRDGIEVVKEVDPMEIQKTMEWFEGTINQIKNEEDWPPNISSKNNYFCKQICGFRESCPYNT